MSSEHLQLLIAGYVLGDLDPTEATEFERLLQDYPEIAQEVEQMQKALELSYRIPETAPPLRLRAAILDAHSQQTDLEIPQATHKISRRNSFPWSRAINVAAAVLIVILGVNNYSLRQTLHQSQTENQRLAALTYSLLGTGEASRASATVTVNPNDLEAVLTARNLPLLPPGKVYVLWTLPNKNAPVTTDQRGAILTDFFTVDAKGNVSQPIVVPKIYRSKELVTKLAITIEDAAAPQRHQGEPLLLTQR